MTTQKLIDHVEESIARSLRHQAWIDESVLSIGGFSTGVIRRLFSNLVHLPKEESAYLEAGLFRGASVCAAMNNSPDLHVYGVENFSQPFGEEGVREDLERNIAKYRDGAKSVTIIDADCLELDLSLIKHPIDVMFVDAEHSRETQRDALIHLYPCLDNMALIVVDDADWESVRDGNRDGFTAIKDKIKIVQEWHLTDRVANGAHWHNGVFIAVIEKR